jgi:uncharacterized protein involved in outer membrane biogenesis
MKNWRRVALLLAGAFALLAVAAGLAIQRYADPQRLAQEARARVHAAWNRDLTLRAVDFELLPRPVMVAEDVTLSNAPWAKDRDFTHADRLVARLALLPLLVGTFRVERVTLEGALLNLEVGRDGAKSWEMRPPEGPHATAAPASAGGAWMRVGALAITNGVVRYRTPRGVELWRIDTANVETSDGKRDVRIDAKVVRNARAMAVSARLDDLSRMGQAGATTRGVVDLEWPRARFHAEGELPVERGMQRGAFDARLEGETLQDMLAFFGVRARHTAPIKASAHVALTDEGADWDALDVTLGKQRVTGQVQLRLAQSPPAFTAQLASADLDWAQALVDAGDERPAPPPEGEMFSIRLLPWAMLAALQGTRGAADVRLARLLLPDGITLTRAAGHFAFDGDRLEVKPVSADLLGGSASGAMRFEARKQAVHVDLTASGVLLERWFHERHRPVRYTGGPMKVRANFSATGNSIKQLAGTMTGPVSIAMGPGVYASPHAGDWEARMASFTRDDSAKEIDFECAGAALQFRDGRAEGDGIIGARSKVSGLVLSGGVSLREESADLTGPVHPRGNGVGLAAIADDIRISGPIRKLAVSLDPASTPKVIAKGAAAVATAGLSVIATADAARNDPDPCEAPFKPGRPARP